MHSEKMSASLLQVVSLQGTGVYEKTYCMRTMQPVNLPWTRKGVVALGTVWIWVDFRILAPQQMLCLPASLPAHPANCKLTKLS